MNSNEVQAVLEDLRITTRHLHPATHQKKFDLDQVEKAVAQREHSVARLRELTLLKPDAFTLRDVEELQRILAEGKRAFENLIEMRRRCWTTSMEFRKKEFVLKTFMRFGENR